MSLSQLANDVNKAAAEKRRREAQDRREAIIENCHEKIGELLGSLAVPVVLLDRFVEEVATVHRKGAYNESRSVESFSVYRFRVDDVVLRLQAGSRALHNHVYSPEIGYVAVERTCQCGRTFGVEIDYYPHHNATPEQQAERFIAQVATALARKATCSFCAADMPYKCPTCGRGN